jgi:predicted transcriptional regulator
VRPGERVRDYKRFTVRLPEEVRAQLESAAGALRRPGWRVVVDAIQAYIGAGPTLSEDERRAVRAVLKLHEK